MSINNSIGLAAALGQQHSRPPAGTQIEVPGQANALDRRAQQAQGVIPVGEHIQLSNNSPDPDAQAIDLLLQLLESSQVQPVHERRQESNSNPLLEYMLSQASSGNIQSISAPPGMQDTAPVNPNTATSRNSVRQADPLILDLDGNGINTTGVSQGVNFDIDADGTLDRVSVAGQGDAFLALDKNRNGIIDDGSELFGDQNGAANGFAELSRYDDNNDMRIDQQDGIFEKLSVLSFDSQGVQQTQSLQDANVQSINLDYKQTQYALNQYDTVSQVSGFETTDGQSKLAADVLLGFHQIV